jgi:nucleotide-binding universal stress UspA family protein
MFKRVLLCYDGSEHGRRALKKGAELAISMGAEVCVLAIVPSWADAAMHLSRVAGHASYDSETEYRQILDESLAWLKARDVTASAHLAHGEVIDVILEFAKRLKSDLIVVGQYPKAGSARWWSGATKKTLSEHSPCSVFISIGA